MSKRYYTNASEAISLGNYSKALNLYEKAAKYKNADAYYQMGMMLRDGNMVDSIDYTKSIECFKKAITLGNKEANFELGNYWYYENEIEKAISYYEKDAGENNKFSLWVMALIYKNGLDNIAADSINYITYTKQAAEMGLPNAECEYAIILLEGKLLKKDVNSAISWLEKAYSHNYWNAGSILSEMYYKGTEVPRDMEKGFSILKTCAENGHKDSYNLLGAKYGLGEGVVRDYDKAFFWFNKSAELGESGGMYNLGICYVNGWGTQKDIKKGEALLGQAKDMGNSDATQYFRNKEQARALERKRQEQARALERKRQQDNEVIDCPYCIDGYYHHRPLYGRIEQRVCNICSGRGRVRRYELYD